jgi:RimJ/RimL family protein N-acetyltransferase
LTLEVTVIEGKRVRLRPIEEDDWPLFEEWGRQREAFWGAFQRFQLDHLPLLRQAYQQTGLLGRESSFLLIETLADGEVVGFVRYTLMPFPDSDFPHPEIGFGIPDLQARGQGLAGEAVRLLVGYLFDGYDARRLSALTDAANAPAQRLLASLGFRREGELRQAYFRDGRWRGMAIYGLLREEWATGPGPQAAR